MVSLVGDAVFGLLSERKPATTLEIAILTMYIQNGKQKIPTLKMVSAEEVFSQTYDAQ